VAAYRCRGCGNRTRFEVVSTTTSRALHHYTLGGELTIEEELVTSTRVDDVTCRWCGRGGDVQVLHQDAAELP
jgi:hypothetical protein